ncbi:MULTISPECIES: hypothetical protein [unclassified Sphingomonas]|uniref:hypothetical protein n=1 Tax=Novosphingobium rhizosphaerae TaxID=1551649 RepID=UPI0015CA5142
MSAPVASDLPGAMSAMFKHVIKSALLGRYIPDKLSLLAPIQEKSTAPVMTKRFDL